MFEKWIYKTCANQTIENNYPWERQGNDLHFIHMHKHCLRFFYKKVFKYNVYNRDREEENVDIPG